MTVSGAKSEATLELKHVLYDEPAPSIARITLNRPERRNAQGLDMLHSVDRALKYACGNGEISVIILAAAGSDFSAGHDLAFEAGYDPGGYDRVSMWGEFQANGAEGFFGLEKEMYLDLTERWRNAPKPTIAQVQGSCIAGGNMLAWACDLIIAGEDATFQDNTLDMGVCGAEFFNHPFEMGVRKAKEWLFTSGKLTAEEARERGMVNRVVANDVLEDRTLALATEIAEKPLFALKTTKEALNAAQDMMGRRNAMSTSFALHQLTHSHNMIVHGFPVDISRFPDKIQKAIQDYLKQSGGDPFNIWPKDRMPPA